MNKNLLNYLQKRDKVVFQGSYSIKKDYAKKAVGDNSANEFVEMRISTNSASPIQKSFFGNWREIIQQGCFDEALTKDLFSFMDHKMEIQKTIATTKNGSMKFFKDAAGNYVAQIPKDPNNPLCVELFEKVRSGLVSENSFIFQPDVVEYVENNDDKEADYEVTVIHKKADLISVDPVVLAFYPQNEVKLGGEEMTNEERNKKLSKREDDVSKSEKDDLDKENKDKSEAAVDAKKGDEKQAADDMDKADKEEAEAANDADKEKKEEPVDADIPEDSDPDYKKLYEDLKASLETAKDKEDDENSPSADAEDPTKSMDGEKINSEEDSKRSRQKAIIKNLRNKEGIVKMNYKDLETKFNKINRSIAMNTDARRSLFTEDEKSFMKNKILELAERSGDAESFLNSVSLLTEGAINRNLDASSYSTGTAFVALINDPEVKTELEKALPEIEGAEYINVDTLDKVQKDILIPTPLDASALAEGASSQNMDGSTVSVVLNPTRYSTEYTINPALANSTQTMEANTKQGKSKITTQIRNAFYDNLFKNSTVAFGSLAAGAYDGGFTIDAKVFGASNTQLQIADIDKIIDYAESIYGDEVSKNFIFLMHPQTKTYIMNTVRTLYHGDWISNADGFTYRNIKIITAPQFQGKVDSVSGQIPSGEAAQYTVLFVRKDCIIVRGLNFVTQDNPYARMSEGLLTRYIFTRGEIKLIDPYLNTRALFTGSTPDSKVTADQIAAITTTADLDSFIAAHPNMTRKFRKLCEQRREEIEAASATSTTSTDASD